jgi:hypothetical protein
MPRNGHRYRLVLYTIMLDRWWKYTIGIGAVLLLLAEGLTILPLRLNQYHFLGLSDLIQLMVAGAGVYALMLSLFLIAIRNMAYVQPCADHLRLVTPFLRLNISYRRLLTASSVEMQHLFPVERYKDWRQGLLCPLAGQTATVLDLRGWPLPRWVLDLFLSPFFFPDKSCRLALLVPRWMDFSIDLESLRSTWLDSLNEPAASPRSDLLASITKSLQ